MRRCRTRASAALTGGLALLALCGCSDDPEKVYAGLEMDVVSAPPVPVELRSDSIEVPVGVAVVVAVAPKSSDLPYEATDVVTLDSRDSDVLDVYVTGKEREFVVVGVSVGETCVEVGINRVEEDCIEAVVTEQH